MPPLGGAKLEEYKRKLIESGEDPYDPGGYFIIGGTERALISLEDLAPNRVLVEFNERYGRKVEVAKVFSQKEGYRALTLMEKRKDGQLIVSVPTASGQIPLIILMKALGMEKDEEIYNPFDMFTIPPGFSEAAGAQLAVACGLALRED